MRRPSNQAKKMRKDEGLLDLADRFSRVARSLHILCSDQPPPNAGRA
jgi:hypothetical protein